MNPVILGIIAEYNPFHKGHSYHLETAVKKTGAEASVAVLSSNFTQRGEPALLDKWSRTEMALSAGVDLVLELPVVFSSHNAGPFAIGATDILRKSGVVTHISFGMEKPSPLLNTISDILIQEPQPFKVSLKSLLKKGYSFVEARSMVLEKMLPGSKDFLLSSNNNLALAYCSRLKEKGSTITVVPVQRVGEDFNSRNSDGKFASATAVRFLIERDKMDMVKDLVPSHSFEIMRNSLEEGRLFSNKERLWPLIRLVLERIDLHCLPEYAELGEGLLRRFKKLALESSGFDDLVNNCTSKRHTRGRIQRGLIHTLIAFDHRENRCFQQMGPQYIRVLGFNEKGRSLLKRIRNHSELPLITKSSAPFNPVARRIMDMEHRASRIWEQLLDRPDQNREKNSRPISF